MPISAIVLEDGRLSIEQKLTKPTVYLDHWAIRKFSDDTALQGRFLRALHDCGGTLLFTVQNVVEFSQMSDQRQAARAEKFLDRILPNLFVVDAALQAGFMLPASQYAQELDQWQDWMLRAFGQRWVTNGNRLSADGMLQEMVLHGRHLAREFQLTNESVAKAVNDLRSDADQMRKARASRPLPGASLRNTVTAEMMRDTHLNPRASFTANDASDMVHAIPDAVMCELALLDRKWCDKIEKVRQRFETHGLKTPLAQVFSHRHGGIEGFLQSMKEFSPSA
jgi:hypothetical protein